LQQFDFLLVGLFSLAQHLLLANLLGLLLRKVGQLQFFLLAVMLQHRDLGSLFLVLLVQLALPTLQLVLLVALLDLVVAELVGLLLNVLDALEELLRT